MFNEPLAYLITWTCYGTHLHGSQGGSYDDDTNQRGAEFVPPSYRYENLRRQQMKEEALVLGPKERGSVYRAILRHVEYRGWRLLAINVRTNHIHVVVEAAAPPREMLRQFKAYSTRGLRADKLIPGRERVWTDGGSTRWLFTREAVNAACDYVLHQQGAELPME